MIIIATLHKGSIGAERFYDYKEALHVVEKKKAKYPLNKVWIMYGAMDRRYGYR